MESALKIVSKPGNWIVFQKTLSANASEAWDLASWLVPPLEYEVRTVLFEQGSIPSKIFLIEKGLIKLTRLSSDGLEFIASLRSAGSFLGAGSAIAQKNHPFSAVTILPSLIRCLDLRVFLNLARTDTKVSWYLHEMHALEMHDQARQLMELRCLSARQRFEQLIWQVLAADTEHPTEPVQLRLPLKRWEMAQLIGVTPEHLCRVIKELEMEGTIQSRGGTLIVLDVSRLYHSGEM